MKTIKIIDLLNKIANGEEVPKRIKYKDEIRDYVDDDKDYICSGSKNYFLFFNILRKNIGEEFKKALNDEVEIIEENKLPEKIPEEIIVGKKQPKHRIKKIEKKINEIISYLDYLESKEKGE